MTSNVPIALQVVNPASPFQNLFYGNAGDSLYSHNDIPFSTFDVDNDNRDGDFGERSCARLYKVSELGCLDPQGQNESLFLLPKRVAGGTATATTAT